VARSFASICEWTRGRGDGALRWLDEADERARTADPYNRGFALVFRAIVHGLRREPEASAASASAASALAREQSVPLIEGLARLMHGWAVAAGGRAEEGVAEVQQALALLAQTGTTGGGDFFLSRLAEAQRLAGRPDEAARTLDLALSLHERVGLAYRAGVEIERGDLLLAKDGCEAEAWFRRALDTARAQEYLTLELRAATHLAALLQRRGRTAEARELVAPLHARFDEGLGTPDLVEARAVLDSLPAEG
jgi:predicted ATPase